MGAFHRVRVSQVKRGPRKVVILLYYGLIDKLEWDPHKLQWATEAQPVQLMEYSSKLGRDLLKQKHVVHNPVTRKWGGVLPDDFQLKWKTVWLKDRTRKEAGLLWLIWHRAVAVNHWRERIDGNVDIRCLVCPRRSEESVLHRFWECLSVQRAWQWAIHVMNALVEGRDAQGPWQMLTWRQGIFSNRIPRKFNHVKRTVVLWTLWIERNDMIFNNQAWSPAKQLQHIWSAMVDYGRVEWDCIRIKKQRSPAATQQLIARFITRRCSQDFFATMVAGQPQWVPTGPMDGFVFQPP